jgi:hypothetical protein
VHVAGADDAAREVPIHGCREPLKIPRLGHSTAVCPRGTARVIPL